MESTGPNGYALFGAMGVFDWILQSLSRIGARVPLESSTLAIALALMVGLKHPIRRRIHDALRRLEKAQPATIAKVLGISRQLASYHLAVLEKSGRVRRQGVQYRLVTGR